MKPSEPVNTTNDASEGETVRTATPRSKRRNVQDLADAFGKVAAALCGGLIVMWSVFNLSWNILQFRADTSGENNWLVAVVVIAITCVLPLLGGFWLLFGSLNNKSIRQKP